MGRLFLAIAGVGLIVLISLALALTINRRTESHNAAMKLRGPGIECILHNHLQPQSLWERAIDGDNTYDALSQITVDHVALSNEQLASLERLPGLKICDFKSCPNVDEALSRLGKVGTLASVSIEESGPTTNGLRCLCHLPDLDFVGIHEPTAQSLNLDFLKSLPGLRTLMLRGPFVNDEALDVICDCETIVELYLWESNLTESGLARLKNLQNIKVLHLRGQTMSTRSIECISQLRSLKELDLSHCTFGTSDLSSLDQLHNLGSLDLENTDASRTTVAQLTSRLPNCRILSDYEMD